MRDSTLVMISSEFGRTPKINPSAGRDHWPKVFSVVLAGGGIKKGFIYGKSDATASEPDEDGLTVEDLAHTVYHCLGIDADKKLMSPGDRPIDIVREGKTRKACSPSGQSGARASVTFNWASLTTSSFLTVTPG